MTIAGSPADADAAVDRGYVALRSGSLATAAEVFTAILTAQPGEPRALQGLGQTLGALGHHDEALRVHQAALAIDPGSAAAQVGLGVALLRTRALSEAVAAFEAATRLAPELADGHANLSLALLKLGRPADALKAADMAIAASPEGTAPWLAKLETCRANCLKDMGELTAAHRSYDRALSLDPDLAEAHVNRGTLHLAEGRFAAGWADYEWRWRAPDYGYSAWRPGTLAWQGEALAGRTILLTAEQGLGDTIQFIRYASVLARRGARVVLCCQPSLVSLLTGVDRLAGITALPGAGGAPTTLPAHDCHAPLMSLPHLFATAADTIPAAAGYLSARRPSTPLQALLAMPSGRGPRVGLVWAGNPRHANDHNRSIALERLAPLAAVSGQLYALQLGAAAAQRATVSFADRIVDLAPTLTDFAETAAALSALDAIVTVDTAVAHLAGALGRPTLLLLPEPAEWRWSRTGDSTPWYDSIRLYRQSTPGEWRGAVDRAAADLTKLSSAAAFSAMEHRVAVDDDARL